jgi:hypothetical protein
MTIILKNIYKFAFCIFTILLISSNVQSSEDEINMYKPDNFELKGGTCFNLKFREAQYKEGYISMRGQNGRVFLY